MPPSTELGRRAFERHGGVELLRHLVPSTHPLRLDEAQEFADACGGDAEDVFLTLSIFIFVKTLAFQPAGAHHRDQARNPRPAARGSLTLDAVNAAAVSPHFGRERRTVRAD